MTTIKTFIKPHPVLTFYAVVFAISWGGVFMVVGGPAAIPGPSEQVDRLWPVAMLVWFAGPSLAGSLLTGLVAGRAGFRDLLTRMARWRVGTRWYAVALLTAPLLYVAVLPVLSLLSPASLPGLLITNNKAALLLFGITWGLIGGGSLEELGWTGFAIPLLRRRYGLLATGLIVGTVWGAWHFLLFWESDSFSGALPLALLLVRLFAWLPAYRVLLVWVYDHTESLLVAMLMHVSLVFSQLVLRPLATGTLDLTGTIVWAAVLWLVVAAVDVANRGHRLRPPLHKEMAGARS